MASTVHEERPSTSGSTNQTNHYPRYQRAVLCQPLIRQPNHNFNQQQQWIPQPQYMYPPAVISKLIIRNYSSTFI